MKISIIALHATKNCLVMNKIYQVLSVANVMLGTRFPSSFKNQVCISRDCRVSYAPLGHFGFWFLPTENYIVGKSKIMKTSQFQH